MMRKVPLAAFTLAIIVAASCLCPPTQQEIRSQSIAAVVNQVVDAVVKVDTHTHSGSGVVVRLGEDVFILTCRHVLMANPQQPICITTQKNQHFSAMYVFGDRQKDLALLYTPFLSKDCKVMELQSDDVVLGEEVLVFGYPVAGSVTVTRGIVSGLNRTLAASDYMSPRLMVFSGLVQTDAAINGGNSGGPVVNMQNQLVGIVQLASIHCNDIGFFISSQQIREFLDDPYLKRLDRNLLR